MRAGREETSFKSRCEMRVNEYRKAKSGEKKSSLLLLNPLTFTQDYSQGRFCFSYLASRLLASALTCFYLPLRSQFLSFPPWVLPHRPNILGNPMPIVATIKLNGNYQEI